MLALALALPGAAPAQTKDDTIVYALQSDIDTWDPPGSVLRETIILGYQVFDHLAVRDLELGRDEDLAVRTRRRAHSTHWQTAGALASHARARKDC